MFRSSHASHTTVLLRTAAFAALIGSLACGDPDVEVVPAQTAGASAATSPDIAGTSGPGTLAITGNADQDFLRMMSDHHQGLIMIARPAKGRFGVNDSVRADAGLLEAKQAAELDSMTAMLKSGFNDPYMSNVLPRHQVVADTLAKQSGPAFSRTFYQFVITHHKEGDAVIDRYLSKLTRPDVKSIAQRMRDDHKREIADAQRKLDAIK